MKIKTCLTGYMNSKLVHRQSNLCKQSKLTLHEKTSCYIIYKSTNFLLSSNVTQNIFARFEYFLK